MKKIFLMLILLLFPVSVYAAEGQKLPAPDKKSELMTLIERRQSARNYSAKEIDKQTLSEILWAAFGLNERGTRTIPTAMNKQNLKVYVVYQNTIWLYDAQNNSLVYVGEDDTSTHLRKQDFMKDAPVNLIYAGSDTRYSTFHAGAAAQNVSLYAADKGLNSIVRGYIDADVLKEKLKLEPEEFVIINQVVGYADE